ncbi:unnamed protein product, partial [Mesorhabditis spiculigera]
MWGGDKCCRGVDLNRNFDHHWAETGSSYEPCSNLYHGDYVFSEPEASSVRKFLETEEMWGKTDAFLTLHTYAQLWIYPFSHQEVTYPKDIDELKRTARKAVSRLENVYGTVYRMGTGADTLAPASGGSDDWAKSKMHVKFVYLIELRPEEHLSHGFILHKKELIPTGIETLEGLKEPKAKSPEEIEKLRREQVAKKRELEARKREPLVVEYAITVRYRVSRGGHVAILDNERRLEQIRLREAEDRRKEEQRVAEEERQKEVAKLAELEKKKAEEELEKEKIKAIEPIVRVARKLVDGRIEEKEVEVLEAQSDTGRSDASLVTVAEMELPPKSSTAAYTTYSPLRIPPNAVTQSYTRYVPIAFRDPSCRDLRYSCSFWLKNSPEVCVTQRSFMRAQCAYTCRFCQPAGEAIMYAEPVRRLLRLHRDKEDEEDIETGGTPKNSKKKSMKRTHIVVAQGKNVFEIDEEARSIRKVSKPSRQLTVAVHPAPSTPRSLPATPLGNQAPVSFDDVPRGKIAK